MQTIGIDVGYGHTKVVAEGVPGIFPSLVGPARTIDLSFGGKETPGDEVEWEGEKLFVGNKAFHHSDMIYFLRSREWVQNKIYAALIISALKRAGVGSGDEAIIVTGLPVEYMGDRVLAEDMVKRVCDSMGVTIVELKVLPQPVGSFFDILLDQFGMPNSKNPVLKRMGFIDIGYNTTDFILIGNCEENIERAAGSTSKGAHDAYSLVQRELKNDFRRNEVSIKDAEEAVRTRFFKSGGVNHDVTPLVHKVLSQIGTSICNLIASKWGPEGEIDKVWLTGGGCALLRQYIMGIAPITEMIQGPQIANARGYHKRALALMSELLERGVN
jgi:plasmid segregation protein ParM